MPNADVFYGILSGYGEASRARAAKDYQEEQDRRKSIADYFLKESQNPNNRPESQHQFASNYLRIVQTPGHKKLDKDLENISAESLSKVAVQPQLGSPLWQQGQTTRQIPLAPSPIGGISGTAAPPAPPPMAMGAPAPAPPPRYTTMAQAQYTPAEQYQRIISEATAKATGMGVGHAAGQMAEVDELVKRGIPFEEAATAVGVKLPTPVKPPVPPKAVVVGQGQALVDPDTGDVIFQGEPKPSTDRALQSKLIEDPANPKIGLLANYHPDTGQYTHPATGAVIPDPRPFKDITAMGNFFREVDDYGNITTYFNPKSGQAVPSQGGRAVGVPSGEMLQRSTTEVMLEDINTLEQLGKDNPSALGAVMGRLTAAQRLTIGTSPEVNELFRIADNLSDQLLRARSGAQINEQEYARLRPLVPNPRGPSGKFFSDLKGFRSELKRILAKRTGRPGEPTPPPSTGFSVGAGGKTYTFKSQKDLDSFKHEAGIQ